MSEKIILAVDDDEDILSLLSVVITGADFGFIGVNSEQECLDKLAEEKPCLIILDVEMPEMNGFETLENIREKFPDLTMPVAFLTAHKSFDMIERAAKLGSKTFILKPFNPLNLVQRLAELTSQIKPFRHNS